MIKPGAGKLRPVTHYVYAIAVLAVILTAIWLAGNHPALVEKWYARKLYMGISKISHGLLGWLPFSLGDVLYLCLIIYLICSLVQFVRCIAGKQLYKAGTKLLRFVIGLQIFIAAFYLMWGINYSRPTAAEILNLPDSSYTLNELQAVTRLLIDSTNKHRAMLASVNTQPGNTLIYRTAKNAIQSLAPLHPALQSFYPAAKPALFTLLTNYMGTAGYFNPFTGEAQVNYAMPILNRPITACHEMAHQMGFAREDEANFIGFLAGSRSADKLLQYSAYYLAMDEFMRQVYRRDTVMFKQLKMHLSAPVKHDIKAEQLYWQGYQNQVGYITGLFYDQYLKANKQPEGLRSYNRMINLTIAYYRRNKAVG